MKISELEALSEAIARRAKLSELLVGTVIKERRGLELTIAPSDSRYASLIVEIDSKDASGDRVKGARVRLAQSEAANWDQLEARFGPFVQVAELLDAPDVPPTRVGVARPDGALPQTIRIGIDTESKVTSFVVRERYE